VNGYFHFSLFLRSFVNFVFPLGNCRLCGEKVEFGFPQICFSYLKKRRKISGAVCNVCGREIAEGANIQTCGECLTSRPSYERHISVYGYEGAIREMVLAFKVLKRYPFYRIFGKSVARNVKRNLQSIRFDFVTFVPTPYTRRILRGFSPAELIAKKCAKDLTIPIKNLLKLQKHPKPQKNLSAKQRKENLKGAFACSERLNEKTVLLVDDIFTTGATIEEASKVLKKSGAKVYAATFAMRRKRDVDMQKSGIED